MSLSLVTGAPGSGKTELLYEVVRSATPQTVPIVLLPSALDARRARSELLVRDGLVGVHVEQVDQFLSTLWELHGDGRRLVTPLQRAVHVRSAIVASDLHGMTKSASTPGFASLMERLVAVQPGTPCPNGADLASEVVRAIVSYQRSLSAEGLIELSEATDILASRVRASWFEGPLVANGFDDLTQSQESFFVAASLAGARVWLAVTGGTDSRVMSATAEVIERLRGFADQEIQTGDTREAANELVLFQRALYSDAPPMEAGGAVALSVACGEEAEAERIAAELLSAAASGIPFGEMAVIYRDTNRHRVAVQRAFAEVGVPADFDALLSFSEIPFGRAILTLLDYARSGNRRHLVGFMASGYAGIRPDDVDALDALWRRRRPAGEGSDMLSDLERVSSEARRFVTSAARLARVGVGQELAESWKDLAGRMLAYAYGSNAPLLDERMQLDALAHRKLCDAVDDMSEFVDAELQAVSLRDVLADARVAPAQSEALERVQVMDAERARGRRFKYVVIAGLVEGEFPRSTDEGVLESGGIGTRLAEQGIILPREGGIDKERLLFYLAVTRAREHLILSRQESDSNGRPLRPSTFLEEALAHYATEGTRPSSETLVFADLGLHPAAPELPRRALRTIALSDGGEMLPPVARARLRNAARPERISDAGVLAKLAARDVFSATELETYSRCPYSWFYMRFLSPEPLGERGEALLGGEIAHKALRDFYLALPGRLGHERVTPETVGHCLDLCDSVVEAAIAELLTADRVEKRLLAQEIRSRVRRLVARDAEFLPGFTPRHHEWSFGSDGEPAEDLGGFALKGQVDRIDVSGDRLVVIDYKWRHATPAAQFENEGILQAPLYAEVARRRLDLAVAGTFYRSLSASRGTDLSRGAFSATAVTGNELVSTDAEQSLEEIIAQALARGAAAADGIRSGHVPRRPRSESACVFCGARSWCEEALVR